MAGRFKWHFWVDEFVFILEGEATVREDCGTVHELKEGDLTYLPALARGALGDSALREEVLRS